MGFLWRWVLAFVLVAATFNPTEFNYIAWVTGNGAKTWSFIVLAGLVLFIGYVIYLRATIRSIGVFGMLLVLAVFGALLWVLYDLGWLRLTDQDAATWLGIVALSLVMAIGMSWSFVRRALSGQYDMDDVDE